MTVAFSVAVFAVVAAAAVVVAAEVVAGVAKCRPLHIDNEMYVCVCACVCVYACMHECMYASGKDCKKAGRQVGS